MYDRTSRRLFLGASGAGAAAVMLGTGAWPALGEQSTSLPDYPFTLGVASGDPQADGIVLWTRLAPDPYAEDGRGGMGDRRTPVRYEVAEDEGFRKIVRADVVLATPELGHSVHPEVDGLEADREYFYRFSAGGEVSPIGRTRTAPDPSAHLNDLNFAFTSCQSYEGGLYTGYKHMASDDLDLVLHLGDYIYEQFYTEDPKFHHGGSLPAYFHNECITLDRYRLQYSLYKSDEHLQAAHAQFPWIFTFDDHEVYNNWKGGVENTSEELARRAAAFQAMYENLPLRHAQKPSGPDIQIYRKLRYGSLADFTMLDSHSFRSDSSAQDRLDPEVTNLGHDQRDWLVNSFSESSARWQVIGNQQPMAEVDRDPDPDVKAYFGSWDFYAVERNTVLQEAKERGVDNLVVVSGDRHSNYVMDLLSDYDHPEDAQIVGSEFVGTSMSSEGDGADMLPVGEDYLEANSHMKFFNFQRGYSRVNVTPDMLSNEFRVMPYVEKPDAPIHTRATYVVEDGIPGATRGS